MALYFLQDDYSPHMPTDDIVLDKEQVQISDSTSTSKVFKNNKYFTKVFLP